MLLFCVLTVSSEVWAQLRPCCPIDPINLLYWRRLREPKFLHRFRNFLQSLNSTVSKLWSSPKASGSPSNAVLPMRNILSFFRLEMEEGSFLNILHQDEWKWIRQLEQALTATQIEPLKSSKATKVLTKSVQLIAVPKINFKQVLKLVKLLWKFLHCSTLHAEPLQLLELVKGWW